jgi:hypothetical protein
MIFPVNGQLSCIRQGMSLCRRVFIGGLAMGGAIRDSWETVRDGAASFCILQGYNTKN